MWIFGMSENTLWFCNVDGIRKIRRRFALGWELAAVWQDWFWKMKYENITKCDNIWVLCNLMWGFDVRNGDHHKSGRILIGAEKWEIWWIELKKITLCENDITICKIYIVSCGITFECLGKQGKDGTKWEKLI